MDANYGDVGASRVIFDMGADTGFVFIDNVSLLGATSTCNNGVMDGDETGIDCGGSCDACVMAPTMAAPAAPARPEADVVSIYSDSYTGNIAFDNFDAGWCGGAAVNGIMIAGNNTLEKKPGIDCHGIDFQSDRQDLSDFTHIHFDFYTNDTDLAGDVFNVKLVDFGGGGSESSALEVNINGGTMPQLVANQWVSVDLDITALGGIVTGSLTRSDIAQIGITTANVTNVWYDNIYLHKNTLLGIEDFNKTVFSTYPNPTKNSWTVKTESTKMTNIQLFDVLGKNVLSMSPNSRETKIDASNLKAGLYFARINTEFGTSSIKLIKN
ncbi:T9SS type A sorting domain-containing protein [Algibacter amylolyticus]|uniref:T9SS type A sorting domain-containing protein n=2 Tax=Algibacter amylolyticus TaxID=1608400 RepID=A0A5M7BHN3_9FLAO|nr:T9SS type A sorting domain-containing protein [Algibacter amylolyticus]TSJ82445.1 T9SS type A sorting domain-containing protein [Algibacter amylolyticus]